MAGLHSQSPPSFFARQLSSGVSHTLRPPYFSCHVSSRILSLPPLWLHKHADLRTHDFAPSRELWREPTLANVTCFLSWGLLGITAAVSYITNKTSVPVIVMRFVSAVEAVLRAGRARWRVRLFAWHISAASFSTDFMVFWTASYNWMFRCCTLQ